MAVRERIRRGRRMDVPFCFAGTDDLMLVPGAGLEPASPYGQEILSLPCMPFHHPGRGRQAVFLLQQAFPIFKQAASRPAAAPGCAARPAFPA